MALWSDPGCGSCPSYGNEPPPEEAKTEDTAARRTATADTDARTRDRSILICRLRMPGSFQGQGVGSMADGMVVPMRVSTIAKHSDAGSGTVFARILGREIRRRRIELGLSQASVGRPLSRAYISSVEAGRLTPSLPSLLLIARRLNSSAAAILSVVEMTLEELTKSGSHNQTAIPR